MSFSLVSSSSSWKLVQKEFLWSVGLVGGIEDWYWGIEVKNWLKEGSCSSPTKVLNWEAKELRKVILEWEEGPMNASGQGLTKGKEREEP